MRFRAFRQVALVVLASTTTTFLASRCSADTPGEHQAALLHYEILSKSVPGAVAWELIPGAGSLYADDTRGAVLTWAGLVVGTGMVLYGLGGRAGYPDGSEPPPRQPDAAVRQRFLYAGLGLALAARLFGFVNAGFAARRYNDELKTMLGLAPALSFAAPAAASGGVAPTPLPGLVGRF